LGRRECQGTSDDKTIKEEGKPTREAKDAFDQVLTLINDDDIHCYTWLMQTTDPSCALSTLDLPNNELYVAMHRHSFNIALAACEFKKMKTTSAYLVKMQRDITGLADMIHSQKDQAANVEKSFNRKDVKGTSAKLAFNRDTFYSPLRAALPKIPNHYYDPPPNSILSKLQN
jgi:hypothetical protein